MLPQRRSLNLSNSAAIAIYEAARQLGLRRPGLATATCWSGHRILLMRSATSPSARMTPPTKANATHLGTKASCATIWPDGKDDCREGRCQQRREPPPRHPDDGKSQRGEGEQQADVARPAVGAKSAT